MDYSLQDLIIAFAISCGSIVPLSIYFYCKNKHLYWERKGVKGPKPWPLVGTILRLYFGDRMQVFLENAKKYGKVHGVYQGLTPMLVVSDPEVIQQIAIKDFDAFPNHGFEDPVFSNEISRSTLIALQGVHWKKVRAFMSPTFTSGKIKRMFRFLDDCSDDMINCAKEQISGSPDSSRATVDAKEIYNLYAMDAIATCCYGLKLDRAGSNNLKSVASRNEFVCMALKFFEFSIVRLVISLLLPKPLMRLTGYTTAPMSKIKPLVDKVQVMMEKRQNTTKKFDDYLQLLVDSRLDAEMELDDNDQAENHHAGLTRDSLIKDQKQMLEDVQTQLTTDIKDTKAELSDLEILSNAVFLLSVGLETTGTLLTHCTCILAFHKEVQMRLYEEVSSIAEHNENKSKFNFSYEDITSCKYLDAVICETLRIYPPVLMIDRKSVRDYRIEKYGLDLPPGSRVFLGFYPVQNDPDLWDEPDKFNPDRFLPENRGKIVPGSYCPFGLGPRHCIGMRFSLTETKLALAKLLMNFRFEPTPDASWPMKSRRSLGINNVKHTKVIMINRS